MGRVMPAYDGLGPPRPRPVERLSCMRAPTRDWLRVVTRTGYSEGPA